MERRREQNVHVAVKLFLISLYVHFVLTKSSVYRQQRQSAYESFTVKNIHLMTQKLM